MVPSPVLITVVFSLSSVGCKHLHDADVYGRARYMIDVQSAFPNADVEEVFITYQ